MQIVMILVSCMLQQNDYCECDSLNCNNAKLSSWKPNCNKGWKDSQVDYLNYHNDNFSEL